MTPVPPTRRYDYVTDGLEIYRRSFGTIRDEADLRDFAPDLVTVATRIIHGAGDVDIVSALAATHDLVATARGALEAGAPIFTDSHMLASGVTRRRLPADNDVICTLREESVPELARQWGTTRAAAAVSLWGPRLEGAVVAIGNAPTALFHLLNMLEDPACPRPAAIIGCPVGFVGAAESKDALMEAPPVPSVIVKGRLGGSAITVAAVNALASRKE